jgi:outer membrane protein OmpA-like peptidoglycan-associated protein
VLQRVATSLNKFDGYKITIEGHANQVERTESEAEFNLQLSSERAQSIKNMLSKMGVSAERISTVGKGDKEPVVPFEDKPNWWKNRRVEFILQK